MNHAQQGESIRFDRDKSLATKIADLRTFVDAVPAERLQKIINASGYQLAAMLNNGQTTSVEVVKIFSFRAGTLGKDVNAITEDNFVQAIEIAAECDRTRAEKGWKNAQLGEHEKDSFPPLFGIPLSVKDSIDLKGFASTIGLVENYKKKCERDGGFASVLRTSGMIPFVKSNLPQLGYTFESGNAMFGDVQNPWDKARTSGGSTGGEAALLALRATVIGIGSDIGGSLRNPAEFCGICSLKPCSSRFLFQGHARFAPSICGQSLIKCVMGPMARSVEDLACFTQIMGDEANYKKGVADPYKRVIPFDYKVYQRFSESPQKLRIGYFDSLEIFPTSKASKRAVDEVVTMLKQKGHTLIPIKVPNIEEIIQIMMGTLMAEGGIKGIKEMLKGEPLSRFYHTLSIVASLPKFLVWILSKALLKFKPRMGMIVANSMELSTHDYLKLSDTVEIIKRTFVDVWRADNLDLVVCPGFGMQAPKIGTTNDLGLLPCVYNFMWNVLDLPAGSLPVTVSREDEQVYERHYNDLFERSTIQIQEGAVGLPVGIQVVGMPFEEEKVLGLMKYIEGQVNFKNKHQYPA